MTLKILAFYISSLQSSWHFAFWILWRTKYPLNTNESATVAKNKKKSRQLNKALTLMSKKLSSRCFDPCKFHSPRLTTWGTRACLAERANSALPHEQDKTRHRSRHSSQALEASRQATSYPNTQLSFTSSLKEATQCWVAGGTKQPLSSPLLAMLALLD